jgi:hypothetical protein
MSDINVIKITAAVVTALATEMGCHVKEQKSFWKITADEDCTNRKAIYVAKSKRVLTRVDFAGFEVEECELIKAISEETAKELRLGKVRGQLLTKNLPTKTTDEQILDALKYPFSELLNKFEGFKLGKKAQEEEAVEEVSEEVDADLEEEHLQMAADDALDMQRDEYDDIAAEAQESDFQ